MIEVPFIEWDEFQRKFRWEQGEHLTVIGPNGAGKTRLALEILDRRKYVVVFATKKRDPLLSKMKDDGFQVIRDNWSGDWKVEGSRILLHPSISRGVKAKVTQQGIFYDALDTVYNRGGWTVLLDEATYISNFLKLTDMYELLLQQGRTLGVTIMSLTQRPVNIPLYAYDQAIHIFFFREGDEANLRRMGGLGGMSNKVIRQVVSQLKRYEVLYLNTRTGYLARTRVT